MMKQQGLQRAKATRRRVVFIAGAAACSLALHHGAHALNTCAGTYSASLVHPIQSPNVVQFKSSDDPGVRSALGGRFIAGMRRAEVVTTGRPTSRLDVNAMVIPSSGIVSRNPGSYHGFGWALDTSPTADSVVSSTLEASLTLTNLQTLEISWTASISCKILTNDKGRIVESIGEFLGKTLGKNASGTL